MADHTPRPRELDRVTLDDLVDAYSDHTRALVFAEHGIGEREPVGRLRGSALAALAVGEQIRQRMCNHRWSTMRDALRYGATVAQVATALDLDAEEVRAGLLSWGDGQLRLNEDSSGRLGISPEQHAELVDLVAEDGAR